MGVHNQAAFKAALADGTLPAVELIDSREGVEDEHPPADVQVGEAWTRDLPVGHRQPLWPSTALILTSTTKRAASPTTSRRRTPAPRAAESRFFELGIRVPMMVIPRARRALRLARGARAHLDHPVDRAVFDLPALTARDANSDALSTCSTSRAPNGAPIPAAPAAGTGGCH